MKFALIFISLALVGCVTRKPSYAAYIDAIPLPETRQIGSADIAALPQDITVEELFKRWGTAAGGKELIFVYRSKIDGIILCAFVEPPKIDLSSMDLGGAYVTQMVFVPQGNQPLVAWRGKDIKKNED